MGFLLAQFFVSMERGIEVEAKMCSKIELEVGKRRRCLIEEKRGAIFDRN